MLDSLTITTFLTRTVRRAAGKVSGWLAARPARLLLRTSRVQQKAFASVFCLLSSVAFAATPPNTAISNTAAAAYSIGANNFNISSTAAVNTSACIDTGIRIELLQYVPPVRAAQAPAGTVTEPVQPAGYAPGGLTAGPFVALANPILPGNAAATPLPANLLLTPMRDAAGNPITSYAHNEAIFIRVVSFDANLNPGAADRIVVTLTTSGGDSEVLQLTETGASTGTFVGSVSSIFAAIGSAPTPNDGNISITSFNETITGVYNHINCANPAATIASSSSSLVDPYGIVFDSGTGAAINGATVTLVDAVTNLQPAVYCDDGVTVMPQPIISGTPTICDAVVPAGGFRFPLVAAGNYKLVVAPPAGHAFPSAVLPANLPATVGTPAIAPVILGVPGLVPGGSYGGVFTLWGPAVKLDIPVDPGSTTVTIRKTADKAVVGTGEFVPYTLTVTNNSGVVPVAGGLIADHLPPGFRYQKGSAKLNGVAMADPLVSADARTLTFTLNLAPAATASLRYVLQVTPGARTGMAENTAVAAGGITSNTARASVTVREDLFRNKTILIGRVIEGSCDDQADNDAKGLANARVLLQNGAYVLTDSDGRWHIDNLRAGTHVVQLDLDSLPRDYEVVRCEQNSRFAGRMYSQFVNLRGGSLWRADFHVQKKAVIAPRLAQTLDAKPDGGKSTVSLTLVASTEVTGYSATLLLPDAAGYVRGSAKLNGAAIGDPDVAGSALIFRSQARPAAWQDQYQIEVNGAAAGAEIKSMVRFTAPERAAKNLPAAAVTVGDAPSSNGTFAEVAVEAADSKPAKSPQDDDPTRLVERLPYDEAWLSRAQPGNEWLHPLESFHPDLPVVKVAVKHDPKHKPALNVNGEAVSPLLYDGAQANAAQTVSLSTWNAVPVKEGDNRFELVVSDAQGREVSRTVRTIHYALTLDHVEFVPQQSRLIADGKTRPVIAVRFLDKNGVPVRRGISGEFQLNEPYRSWDRRERTERQPLTGDLGGKARYEVKRDGMAMIELEPTTQTGEAILNFQFNDRRTQEVRAWLEPGHRDWVLVGFAEGTAGHKTLSGNVQALKAADTEKQLFDGNKLAFYAKGSIRGDYLLTLAYDTAKDTGNKQLKQTVDPTQYYTLYADATQAGFDAASAARLYVKLERKQFYAMFGDYDTGLSVTELSRYSRTLNGVKSEYKGESAGYNAFASVTSQAYIKDEIAGNGTSGVYRLSRTNLVTNSDKIRIETRDRFQSHVIVSTQNMTRYLDYDIDYALGTLTFREPVATRDANLNPTYIVAEYESADPADKKATFGGRGSFKPSKEAEVGATLVHEGTVGATGNLKGVDASYQIDEKTRLRAEAASTDGNRAGVASSGSAWLGEVQHHEDKWDAKAYVREQAGSFGMGQQAPSEISTRKMGMDGRLKLSDTLQLQGQAYTQENLATKASNSVLEGRVNQRLSDDLDAYYGARTAQDKNAAGTARSNQVIAGASYTMLDRKLALRGAAEVSSGTAGSFTMPNRLLLGADYKMTAQTSLFAEQEFARGGNISANTTRAGLRTQPWSGGEVSASVGSNTSKDAERLYTNLGLVQRWQINEQWQTDFSIDRSQTLRNTAVPLNPNTPLPSGSMTGDYTAAALGAAYHNGAWSGNGRLEIRNAGADHQRNLQLGMQRDLDKGRTLAAGFTMRNADGMLANTRSSDLRFSYAHRPNDSEWVWFDRADYITQFSQGAASSIKGKKLVNNLNANWMPNRRTQVALQYGAKYVLDTIDGTDYAGYTDLFGAEARYDLTQDWDIGVYGSVMRSVNAGVRDYGLGASLGYKVMDNAWLALGYNVRGLNDRDFAGAAYRASGLFVTLRMKVDQDTFGLNKGSEITRPTTTE
ncbi:MAG: DUF11 domain-containing protein [Nitrosomonadales bacterium]|nr:DUF11 domain-containing protein [Nitrosomonadales bacterium]